jgi:hypothetical protein
MKAIPFDIDNKFQGDSEFYPDSGVRFEDGDSFSTLVERYLSLNYVEEERNDTELMESIKIGGFWVVSDEVYQQVGLMWPDDGCGSDSETYSLNRASKRLIDRMAMQVVGPG